MRAVLPRRDGHVDLDGVRIGWEVHGDGDRTIVLLPTWTIVSSRVWKMQLAYLARHHRVVLFDGPGNGRSDRPLDPAPYRTASIAAAARLVLSATGTDRAVLVSLSDGAELSLRLTVDLPDTVLGQVLVGPSAVVITPERRTPVDAFHDPVEDPVGWEKYNAHHWRDHFDDFLEFFFSQTCSEPHSTKQREDGVRWARQTTPEVLITDHASEVDDLDPEALRGLCARIGSPSLVIHGSDDRLVPLRYARALAEALGADLAVLEGSGHIPLTRDPVRVNLLIDAFVRRVGS